MDDDDELLPAIPHDEGSDALAFMADARTALEHAKTVAEVTTIMATAQAARVYAKQMDYGVEAMTLAAAIRLHAACRCVDMVDKGQASGEIAAHGGARHFKGEKPALENPPTLADLGLSSQLMGECRNIRDAFTAAQIEALAADAIRRGKPLAWHKVVLEARYAKAHRNEERRQGEDLDRLAAIPPTVELVHGDFREVLADLRDVDAVITDPPYPREFLPLYGDLAAWADSVLSPDGVLCVLTGHMWLPEVLDLLGRGRPYRWTCAYMTPGSHASVWGRNVLQGWKPMVVYGKGPERFFDVIESKAPDRSLHHWGQSLSGFQQIVDTFTRPGQLVVDPFLGGGTTAAACALADRRFVGCDVDAEAVETSRTRLEQLRT